jgi:hypothetical protein
MLKNLKVKFTDFKNDIKEVITTSQDWWSYGSYGPFYTFSGIVQEHTVLLMVVVELEHKRFAPLKQLAR